MPGLRDGTNATSLGPQAVPVISIDARTGLRAIQVPGDLEAFRGFVTQAVQDGFGIVLKGDVGITSHFGDILRANRLPSRLERQ